MTLLQNAAMTGNPNAVTEALLQDRDLNARTSPNGFTPLHLAVSGTDSPGRAEIVRLLHEAGANLSSEPTKV